MALKNKVEMITTEGKIASFRVLGFFLEHNWAIIGVMLVNLLPSWLLNGQTGLSLWNLILTVIFAGMMLIVEAFVLVVAGVAEIPAEIIAGCIAPRAEEPAAGKEKRRPVTGQTLRDKASEAVFRRSDVSDEDRLCKRIGPAVKEYIRLQAERGIQVYPAEAHKVWFAITLMLQVKNQDTLGSGSKFRGRSVKSMFADCPELMKDFTHSYIENNLNIFIRDVSALREERRGKGDPRWNTLYCAVDLIGRVYNRSGDPVTRENLEKCILQAVEQSQN